MSKIYTLVVNTNADDFYPVFSSSNRGFFDHVTSLLRDDSDNRNENCFSISIEKLLEHFKHQKEIVEELVVNHDYPECPDWDVIDIPYFKPEEYGRKIQSMVAYFEEELKTGCECVTGLVFTSINIDKEEN